MDISNIVLVGSFFVYHDEGTKRKHIRIHCSTKIRNLMSELKEDMNREPVRKKEEKCTR